MSDRQASRASIARHGHSDSMVPEIFFLTITIPSIGFSTLTGPSLLLPSISLAGLASAAIVALAARCLSSDRRGARITLWDVSDAYAFIGCAAGMLSDPQLVLEF